MQTGGVIRRRALAPVAILLIAAAAVSACAPTITSDAAASPRVVTVSATGEAKAVPDAARAMITVEVTDPASSQKAQQDAAVAATATLGALRAAGVADADIATQGLSVGPTYTYTADGGQQQVGFRASQTFEVTLRDLASAGATMDAIVAAGGTAVRIDSLTPFVSDPAKAVDTARAEAVAIAQRQADQYAELLGFSLGGVASVSESTSMPTPAPMAMADASSTAGKVPTPIEPGTTTVSVSVTIAWGIEG